MFGIMVALVFMLRFIGSQAKHIEKSLGTIAIIIGIMALLGLAMLSWAFVSRSISDPMTLVILAGVAILLIGMIALITWIVAQVPRKDWLQGALAMVIIGVITLGLGFVMLAWVNTSNAVTDPMKLVVVGLVSVMLMVVTSSLVSIMGDIGLKSLGIGALAIVVVGAIVFGLAYVMQQWAEVANSVDDIDKLKKVMILGIGAITAVSAIVTILGAIAAIPGVGPLILGGAAAVAGIMGAVTAVAFGIAKVVQEFAKGAELVAKLSRYGIKNEKDLATKLTIPLKALITEDKDGETPLDIIKKLAFKKKNGKTLREIQKYVFPFVASGVNLYNSVLKDVDTKSFDSVMTSSFGTMFKIVKLMQGDKTSSTQLRKIREIRKNIKETRALIKQINTTDINKLKYASNLMSRLAQFSASINGNFKELAKTINKELITAIKELEQVLDELNKNGIKTNGIGISTGTGNESNIKGANENGSAKLDADRYKSTMKDINRMYELDDLIDLLASCIDGTGSERSIRTKRQS